MSSRKRPSKLAIETRAAKERVVLSAAADILSREGPDAFNVRDVAKAVGASTMVIYTLFGGRDGLVDAVQRDALDRLAAAFDAVPRRDSLAGLGRLAAEYRRFALANKEYYFTFSAIGSSRVRESRAFRLLVLAVANCMEKSLLVRATPEEIANVLWSVVHGVVSLELAGHFTSADAAEAVLARAGGAVLAGLHAR
jgi:AcrR family transcriptional regulator